MSHASINLQVFNKFLRDLEKYSHGLYYLNHFIRVFGTFKLLDFLAIKYIWISH